MEAMGMLHNRTRTNKAVWVVTQVAPNAGYAHLVRYEQLVDFDNDRLYWRRTEKNTVAQADLLAGEAYKQLRRENGRYWQHVAGWPWGQDIRGY
jgi:hypothetical protein